MNRPTKFDLSPAKLAVGLRKITEVLAAELARPSPIAPEWSDQEWLLAQAVAAMHGISALLYHKLRWQGPASWVAFLEAQRHHVEIRHARILEFLGVLDDELRTRAIGAVALKGVALHGMGVYQPGERPMADVDLLVHPRDAERTAGLLGSLGFYESSSSWKERAFSPIESRAGAELGEHAHNDLKIELHERICERLPLRLTDVSDLILPKATHPGINSYPSTASLMIHLLLHASGGMACQSLRVLHLHDLALLSRRMTPADWEDLLRTRARGRSLRWAWPPLALTARYFPLDIPADVTAALRRECPPLLRNLSRRRCISDVSYSYSRIDAFPGIEWSQSAGEMISYARSRIRPSDAHLAWRAAAAVTDPWAAAAPWSSLSQAQRILRWIVARPTRPVTLYAVNAALARTV